MNPNYITQKLIPFKTQWTKRYSTNLKNISAVAICSLKKYYFFDVYILIH